MDDDIEEREPRPSSARRNMSLRNNAARQVAVNFMPSRQLPYNTIRLRRNNSEHNVLLEEAADAPDSPDKQADIIVREMEQHRKLMEDNPVSEELRREALRDLPQGLTMKRHVRAKLSASVSLRSKRRPISWSRRLHYRISFAWKRSRERLRDAMFSIELWYEAIRHIEGHFGSAVGSYFRMVRRLFLVNAALAALLVAFIVVPQALHDSIENRPRDDDASWAIDWITGKGGLSNSLLFYGHYHDGQLLTAGSYYMPFAYFFTMLALYLVFFAILCYRTADSYRRNFIETEGGLSHVFANKVFCGWDFGIVSEQAASLNAHSIYNELKELLNEQNKKLLGSRPWQRACNACVWAGVFAAVCGIARGVWVGVARAAPRWDAPLAAALTAILAVCPLLLHFIVRLEFYKPRTALYVTLARTWLLDITILMLLFVYWSQSQTQCWETRFGQEMYRLVLLDAVVSLLVLPAIEFFRGLLFKMNPKGSAPEFNIAYNSLTLIYNQSLLWFGMLFSPLLAVVVAIKFLLLFYVKRECALRACQPARKVWRAAQTQTVLYMLVTLSLFTTLFGIGSLYLRMSSEYCGPFRSYSSVYSVVSEGALALSRRHALRAALSWLLRPGVLAFLVLILGVCVYLCRARAHAQRATVALLRCMLVLQAKDKDFLLTAIGKVSTGEWLYSPRSEGEGPDSHTWRYLREVRKPSNANYHFDASRLSKSFADRPTRDNRPNSNFIEKPISNDGDTDSSFSWQGSASKLNAEKEWI